MLSPHEIATLILLRDARSPYDLDPLDLDALMQHQLIALESCPYGHLRPRITDRGTSLLKAVDRGR